jgi:hypothetical protein
MTALATEGLADEGTDARSLKVVEIRFISTTVGTNKLLHVFGFQIQPS